MGRADGWQEPRGVFDQLLTHTSEVPVPRERTDAIFSLSSLLCMYMRTRVWVGFFFFFIQQVKQSAAGVFPPSPPPSHLPAELPMGCSLAYVSVKTSKDLPRNLFQLIGAAGSRRAVQLAGRRSRNLFAWHSWSRGRTDVQGPALLCMALRRCTVRGGPLPPSISYLSGRDARRGEVTVTDAGSKPGSLCSLAGGLIAALCCCYL